MPLNPSGSLCRRQPHLRIRSAHGSHLPRPVRRGLLLNINNDPVTIKNIEKHTIDHAWALSTSYVRRLWMGAGVRVEAGRWRP